jgi:hypothetical protein
MRSDLRYYTLCNSIFMSVTNENRGKRDTGYKMQKQNVFGKWVPKRHPYIHIIIKKLYFFAFIANHRTVCVCMCILLTYATDVITSAPKKVQNSVRRDGATLNITITVL